MTIIACSLDELLEPTKRYLRHRADELVVQSCSLQAKAREIEKDIRLLDEVYEAVRTGHPSAAQDRFDAMLLRYGKKVGA